MKIVISINYVEHLSIEEQDSLVEHIKSSILDMHPTLGVDVSILLNEGLINHDSN